MELIRVDCESRVVARLDPTTTTSVTLGRSRDTGIADRRVSREHVRVTAEFPAGQPATLVIDMLGSRVAHIAGTALAKGTRSAPWTAGARLGLLHSAPDTFVFVARPCSGSAKAPETAETTAPPRKLPANRPAVTEEKEEDDAAAASPAAKRVRVDAAPTTDSVKLAGFSLSLPAAWTAHRTVLVHEHKSPSSSSKIAAFDFDGCLARTSPAGFSPDAWSMKYAVVPSVLTDLHARGYKIVIFTNESTDRFKKREVLERVIAKKTGRLSGFLAAAGVPCQVFIMLCKDEFRKPSAGAWRLLETHFNQDVAIDKASSFFVGDAAGRKGDFSDSDLRFAANVGVPFHTDSDFFRR
eukprot:m.101188 g.101188  ORF g.101188 m.101188 type:complete len:353 (-) comp8958_c0_seq3:48-1106(-)